MPGVPALAALSALLRLEPRLGRLDDVADAVPPIVVSPPLAAISASSTVCWCATPAGAVSFA